MLGKSLLAIALFAAASATLAQNYPARAVRLIVPFPPGGSTDIIGRAVAQKLFEKWGQPVVVDNRPGASGVIGAEIVAHAAPDGYTLLLTTTHFTINPSMMPKLPYDTFNDFAPITLLNTTPLVVVVNPGAPTKSIKELIALAKAKPGQLNFGSTGVGGTNHLAGELFNAMAGVKMVSIPYSGNAPALTALLGGHVDVVFNGITSAIALVKTGKLRPLAVTSLKRSAALPDIPTLDELGLKGFEAVPWNGLNAPGKTPRDIVAKINADAVNVMSSPKLQEQLKAEGSDMVGNSVEQYTAFLHNEVTKWANVIKFAKVKPE